MSNTNDVDIGNIIDDVINYTNPKSKEDLEQRIAEDKINYLVWQVDAAVKELQAEVDKLKQSTKEVS
jgi:folate-dependent phosphoribosylglycinamide formyltransferase PurN